MQMFVSKATSSYILGKDQRFTEQPLDLDANGLISAVERSDHKIAVFAEHLQTYDMIDVFTIVFPKDKENGFTVSSEIEDVTMNLLTQAAKLTPELVALSCEWYNCCVDKKACPYIQENMELTYKALREITHKDVWAKILDEYKSFPPKLRGGPLAFALIYRRIQRTSESAIVSVQGSLNKLRIKDIPEEDVDIAVQRIKTVYTLLESNSTDLTNYVPSDFGGRVLTVLSSSSNSEFNRAFQRLKEDARAEADRTGSQTQWPDVTEVCMQATNMYRRMKNSEMGWLSKHKQKTSAFTAGSQSQQRVQRRCWNCGGTDHLLPECPKPKDQEKIERNKKTFQDAVSKARQSQSRGGARGRPERHRKIGADGRPMIQNKNGVFVVDTKALREQKQLDQYRADVKTLVEAYQASQGPGVEPPPAPSAIPPPPAGAPASAPPASAPATGDRAERIRASLARLQPFTV